MYRRRNFVLNEEKISFENTSSLSVFSSLPIAGAPQTAHRARDSTVEHVM